MSVAGKDDNSTKWSRSGFKDTFKRGRKGTSRRDSDSNSNSASSATAERIIPTFDGRRSSTDSSSALKKVLSGGRKGRLGKNESTSSIQRPETSEGHGNPRSNDAFRGAYNSSAEGPVGSGGSEDYTEDEGEDPSRPSRPTLSPHQSHAGYLTLSSPLINAETLAASTSTRFANPSSQSLSDSLQSRGADNLSPPTTGTQRRSPSPGSRLREAFKPSKKPSTANLSTESDTSKNQANGGGGGGLGSLLVGKARKSTSSKVSLLPAAKVFDNQPIVQEHGEKTPSPKKSSATLRPVITVPATPPNIHGSSIATVVTPPTPTDTRHQRPTSSPTAGGTYSSDATLEKESNSGSDTASSSQSQAAHRRVKSATLAPSKLSNSVSAPLTPAPEEVKTPGGGLVAGQAGQGPGGGFFSSMFSAAQNAANSLSNTIASNTGNTRSRSGTGSSDPTIEGGEEVILPPGSQKQPAQPGERRQLAIETLGSGNLSLSHLGISESSEVSPMASNVDLVGGIRNDELAAKAEDDAAARAVSVAYSEKPNEGKVGSVAPSVAETTRTAEENTPGRLPVEPGTPSIKRAGSVRSRLSGRRRRTRGSSAATGIAVAPLIQGPGGTTAQRLTGFAVANPKRNRDFHNLFRSVPDDDYLIEDYSAALQREILLHGRLYISEGHICFSSNILGWVTNLVMGFDEVISVEKKSTAMIFQNGIVIQTLQARNVFASLLSRDLTYDLIISIWKISHPNLKSSLNGAPVEGIGTGDKTEKAGSVIEDGSASEEIYDEDEEDDDEEGDGSLLDANDVSTIGSEVGDATKAVIRKASAAAVGAPANGGAVKPSEAMEVALAAATTVDFPGAATHEPTDCGDQSAHHEKVLVDTTIPAPLGKIYSLMFGPASSAFMRRWLIEEQKSLDLQLDDDKKGLGADCKSMTYSYIKPLGGSIGPKQTRCMISQNLEQFDLERAVTVACSTQNPDVPSGNVFMVKTRYCLMWGPGNSTRLIITCTIEWSGKRPIEKGANDGQMAYAKDLVVALRNAVSVKEKSKTGPKGKNKGGKRRKDVNESNPFQDNMNAVATAKANEPDWGLLDPLRSLLGPVAPLLSPTVIISFLSITIFIMWWRTPTRAGSGLGYSGLPTPQRIAAYEEIWRTEESELWKWLEERVGIDGPTPAFLSAPGGDGLGEQRVKDMEQRLVSEEMSERQMKEAIKVTRERLEALEVAVLKKHKRMDDPPQRAEVQSPL
ncbi:hypothetical protein E2P81_ATG08662 [Venturia nashicola]|uniref:VASt domain-containing protein n=1 Tax=Venturia nashicola TaxID=86259 RepID=A0A4Z1NHA9_9PEZI|nr:hypothetical protein E6O75_ATG08853 [Venturia nashicola]TLD20998.1 hypothetical protein E2P81_ATG08662 [Venturia nashicola]